YWAALTASVIMQSKYRRGVAMAARRRACPSCAFGLTRRLLGEDAIFYRRMWMRLQIRFRQEEQPGHEDKRRGKGRNPERCDSRVHSALDDYREHRAENGEQA